MKKSLKTRLFSAIAMLTISAIALTSSTYAWFTMINKVTVSGVTLQATTPESIQIKSDAVDYGTDITVTKDATLEHASSTNGVNVYTVDKVDNNGVMEPSATVTPGVIEEEYIDIPLTIKNISNKTLTKDVVLDFANSSISDNSSPGSETLYKAFRFALLNQAGTAVLNGANNVYSEETTASTADIDNSATFKALSSVDGTKAAQAFMSGDYIISAAKLTAGQEYSFTLRVWLEGQDKNCVNDEQEGKAKIDLTFKLAE